MGIINPTASFAGALIGFVAPYEADFSTPSIVPFDLSIYAINWPEYVSESGQLIVPDNVSYIRASASLIIAGADPTSFPVANIRKNGDSAQGFVGANAENPLTNILFNMSTAIVPVVPGDILTLHLQTDVPDVLVTLFSEASWLAIEAIPFL